jgi:hypothetical protein
MAPDPGPLARFQTDLTRLRLRLNNAGVGQIARNVLHNVDTIKMSADTYFERMGQVGFALNVGTKALCNVWACSNGSVVLGRSQVLYRREFEVSDTNMWPSALQEDLCTPLKPKIRALVLFDMVRWVEKNMDKPFNNIRNVIFPNADHLIAALRECGRLNIIPALPSNMQVARQSRRERSQSFSHTAMRRGRSPSIDHTSMRRERSLDFIDDPIHQAEGSANKDQRFQVAPAPKEGSHVASENMEMSFDHTLEEREISEHKVASNKVADMELDGHIKSEIEELDVLDHEGVPNNAGKMKPEEQLKSKKGERSALNQKSVSNNEAEMIAKKLKPQAINREVTEISGEPEQHGSPYYQSRVTSANGVATLQVLPFAIGKELIVHLPDVTAFLFSKQHVEDFFPIRLQIGVCHEANTLSYLWIYLKRIKPSPQIDYIISGTVPGEDANAVDEPSKEGHHSITHGQLLVMLKEHKAELCALFRHFGTRQLELQALAKYGFILAAESDVIDFSNHTIPINRTLELFLQKVCRKFKAEPVNYWSRYFSLSVQPGEKDRNRYNSGNQFATIDTELARHSNLNQLPRKPRKAIDKPCSPLQVLPMRPGSGSPSLGDNMDIEDMPLVETRGVIQVLPSKARYDHTPPSDDSVSDGDTPRADQHLPALRERTPAPLNKGNGDEERPNTKTPVPARSSASGRSALVQIAAAQTNAIREQAFSHRASPGSLSASVGRTASVQQISARTSSTRFHTRDTTKKQLAKLLEGKRVLGRRVRKDRKEGKKKCKTLLNSLLNFEHLRVRGNTTIKALRRMNRKLEDLLQAQLEEPSHEFDAIEELSFQDCLSDACMNGDNPEDEDVSMQDDN